jgi:hypothetical protein
MRFHTFPGFPLLGHSLEAANLANLDDTLSAWDRFDEKCQLQVSKYVLFTGFLVLLCKFKNLFRICHEKITVGLNVVPTFYLQQRNSSHTK